MLPRTRTSSVEGRVFAKGAPRLPDPPALQRQGVYPALKRGFDVLVALLLCVPFLPLILLSALLVKLTTRGPVFYSQVRLGLNGRPFWIFKIRTMIVESEKEGA